MILSFVGGFVLGMFSAIFTIGSWIVFKSEGFISWGRE